MTFDLGQLNDLGGRRLALIDYAGAARRLSRRIATRPDASGGQRLRALIFDGVYGLHCDPGNALAPLDDETGAEIVSLTGKERKSGDIELALIFSRNDVAGVTQTVLFHAQAARWIG